MNSVDYSQLLPIKFPNIRSLKLGFPFHDQFYSLFPSLNRLKSVEAILGDNYNTEQLQTLIHLSPALYSLRFFYSIDLKVSIAQLTSLSIRRLSFITKCSITIAHFNNEECASLAYSQLGQQCEILLIKIENRSNIIDLIRTMTKLRSLVVHCKDDTWMDKDATAVMKDELIEWLPKSGKQIIDNVSGVFTEGMNAIMGPTGCGKSSLLDILADRKDPRGLSGRVFLDGCPPPPSFKYIVGYVVQDDIISGTLTVRENLMFSANVRLSDDVSKDERQKRVAEVIHDLALESCADTRIGTEFLRGVSGGERKRTCIGMELVLSPKILFLGEPTTGLDSSTARNVMECLKELSQTGRTIIFSIHQPRYSIFKLFDTILLMCKGKNVYHGPTVNMLPFFNTLGYNCELHDNPADFALDVLIDANRKSEDLERLTQAYMQSEVSKKVDLISQQDIQDDQLERIRRTQKGAAARSLAVEIYYVAQRTLKNALRNPALFLSQIVVAIIIGLLVGLVFHDMKRTIDPGIQNRLGAIFFIVVSQIFSTVTALEPLLKERVLFIHENVSGYYRITTFFIAKLICDVIPMRILPSIIFSLIAYFMTGLQRTAGQFFIFLLTIFMASVFGSAMCFFIAATIPIFTVALILVVLIFVIMLVFSGFIVELASVFKWLSWIQWISAFRYASNVLTVNEFHTIVLYTLPYPLDTFSFIGGCQSKSTNPNDLNQSSSYDQVQTLEHIHNNQYNISYNRILIPIQCANIHHLKLKFPLHEHFWSMIPTLDRLISLDVTLYEDRDYSQLQLLLQRTPHLHLLKFCHRNKFSLASFNIYNASIRRLAFFQNSGFRLHYFDSIECALFTNLPLASQCEILTIDVQNRIDIVKLINNMPNLQAMNVHCRDSIKYRYETAEILLLRKCIGIYGQIFQSIMSFEATATEFLPANSIELITMYDDISSFTSCYIRCSMNPLCRLFVSDTSWSYVCRLYQGSIDTGSLIISISSTSRVGILHYDASWYEAYNQICHSNSISSNRYLTCINNRLQCPMNTYWNGSMCLNQVYYLDLCSTNEDCRQDIDLQCSLSCQKCLCSSTTFWNGSFCVPSICPTFLPTDLSLIAFWLFNGDVTDSMNNYNGISMGSSIFVSGYLGQAKKFAMNTYVKIPYINFEQQDFTVELWFYLTNAITTNMTLFSECANTSLVDQCFYFGITSNETVYMNVGEDDIYGTTTVDIKIWHHIAFISDYYRRQQFIYLNGLLEKINAFQATTAPFHLGLSGNAAIGSIAMLNRYFIGNIDHVSVTLRAKTSNEIMNDATFVAYYSFDCGSTFDSGPNLLHGNASDYTIVSGRINDALQLNSANSYFQAYGFKALTSLIQPYSFSLWIKPQNLSGTLIHLSTEATGTGSCLSTLGFLPNGALIAIGPNSLFSVGYNVTKNTWTHVVLTFSPATGIRLYLNKTMYSSSIVSVSGTLGSTAYLTLGSRLSGPSSCASPYLIQKAFLGTIDEVRVYSRLLDGSDVCMLYS
ncbi:hypothetical protein I4U23_001429 [Adineta vaga]|nr:hypothetical protein I4U23_001429 [Adineta vaga]